MADWAVGMHGGNGIIGASAPHALGAAFSAKYKRTGGVAVAFGGDGASNQGAVFESMNFAKAYELPVVFVLEDNGYAESTHKSYTTAGDPVSRASGFDIPATSVDGADFFAVADAAGIRARPPSRSCRDRRDRRAPRTQPSRSILRILRTAWRTRWVFSTNANLT